MGNYRYSHIQLKIISRYIAIALLALFTVALLPFNAMHHHAEDEHMAAMLHREHHPAHHCDLDEQFCQSGPNADCGHDTHLSKPHPKCFACDFHFIKLFEAANLTPLYKQVSAAVVFQELKHTMLNKAFIFVGNKGPPATA